VKERSWWGEVLLWGARDERKKRTVGLRFRDLAPLFLLQKTLSFLK